MKAAKAVRRAQRKDAATQIQETDKLGNSGEATGQAAGAHSIDIDAGVDFEPYIDQLLELAGVVGTPDARARLNNCLGFARVLWDLDLHTKNIRVPTKHLSALESGIRRMKFLLRKIDKHLSSERIRFPSCPVGEGTVAIQFFDSMKWGETVPIPPDPLPPPGRLPDKVPPGGMIATINIQRTLDRMLCEIALAKRSQARPREEGKRDIVGHAAMFFRERSTAAVTSYPSGQFATFCRSFYEAVTGANHLDLDDLQFQIRAEKKKPMFEI